MDHGIPNDGEPQPRPPEWGLVGDPTAWLPAAPREERSAEIGKIKRGGCPNAL